MLECQSISGCRYRHCQSPSRVWCSRRRLFRIRRFRSSFIGRSHIVHRRWFTIAGPIIITGMSTFSLDTGGDGPTTTTSTGGTAID